MTSQKASAGGRVVPAGTGRALGVVNVAVGIATVVRAGDIGGASWLGLSPRVMAWVVRVLGIRQATQGVLTATRADPEVLLIGAAVDTVHALSMVPVALIRGPYRRPAAVSAALAALSAGVAVAASEQ